MSKFVPGDVAVTDYNIAQTPFFGGEFAAYLSPDLETHIADIEFSAPDTAAIVDDVTTSLPAGGADLAMVTRSPLRSDGDCVIHVIGTDQDDAPLSGVATFTAPGWSNNQSSAFQLGYAVDVVTSAVPSNRKFKTITSIAATNGSRGSKFELLILPDLSGFALVGCSTEKDFTTKSRPSKPIPCGMDGSAFNKPGRSEPGHLTLNQKMRSFGDGIARFDGLRCTAMLIGLKEDLVVTDRILFTGYVPKVRTRVPDGDGEAILECEGNYVDAAYFVGL